MRFFKYRNIYLIVLCVYYEELEELFYNLVESFYKWFFLWVVMV